MIALKIIGSGSLYDAAHVRISQSNESTPTPVCCATRPVLSGSVVHVPGLVPVSPPPPSLLLPLPLLQPHTASASTRHPTSLMTAKYHETYLRGPCASHSRSSA